MTAAKRKRRRPTLGYVLELERKLMIERKAREDIRSEANKLAGECIELRAKLDRYRASTGFLGFLGEPVLW